jgi:hypothetical protein
MEFSAPQVKQNQSDSDRGNENSPYSSKDKGEDFNKTPDFISQKYFPVKPDVNCTI